MNLHQKIASEVERMALAFAQTGSIRTEPVPEYRIRRAERKTKAQRRKNRRRNLLRKLLDLTGDACTYCGKRLSLLNVTIDHYLPKSRGGARSLSNLVPACRRCNNAKADQFPLNFILSRP